MIIRLELRRDRRELLWAARELSLILDAILELWSDCRWKLLIVFSELP